MSELQRVFDRISTRLNDVLCEMKPGYDDSIVGFNEAWDVMRKIFKDELSKPVNAQQVAVPDPRELRDVLQDCRNWLYYAYHNVGSVTSQKVKQALPNIDRHIDTLTALPLTSGEQADEVSRLDLMLFLDRECSVECAGVVADQLRAKFRVASKSESQEGSGR